jgi:hypothetical protein
MLMLHSCEYLFGSLAVSFNLFSCVRDGILYRASGGTVHFSIVFFTSLSLENMSPYTVKKLAIFPPPAGMSLIKLSLGGKN